jgi:pimeloyl-ACP methyl ester carboxylesterase
MGNLPDVDLPIKPYDDTHQSRIERQVNMNPMTKRTINGAELAYRTVGEGEPVLLLHCGFIADSFAPLLKEPALTRQYRLVNYHRRGYGHSASITPPYTLEQQANDAAELLGQLAIPSAHIVGHSFGANIAIQLALSAPERVHSLTLIEPLLGFFLTPDTLAFLMTTIGEAMGAYAQGDKQAALDTWLDGAFGAGWQAVVKSRLPGGYEQALHDVDTAMTVEAASTQTWEVGPQHLREIKVPALSVTHLNPQWQGFQEIHEGVLSAISEASGLLVPQATHLMQIQNPSEVARGLVDFFARNPIRLHA